MKTAFKTENTPQTLYSLVMAAYREAGGDIPRARAKLLRTLSKDKALLASIIDAALSVAISSGLNNVATKYRASIIKVNEAQQDVAENRSRVIALSTGLSAAYMDWPLATGVKLRSATRADLVENINRYSAQASSLNTRAAWLHLVLQALPDDNITVGERLTEARLVELYNEVSAS